MNRGRPNGFPVVLRRRIRRNNLRLHARDSQAALQLPAQHPQSRTQLLYPPIYYNGWNGTAEFVPNVD